MKKICAIIFIAIIFLLLVGCVSSINVNVPQKTKDAISKYENIHLGWIDFKAEDWDNYGYQDKESWENGIARLNQIFQIHCKNHFAGKNISASINSEDLPVEGNILYIKFNNIHINQVDYIVYTSIDFIDLSTNKILLTIPDSPFQGNAFGFENMLYAALSEIEKMLKKELSIPDRNIVRVENSLDHNTFTKIVKADLSHYKKITIGWIDLFEEEWKLWGYGTQKEWSSVIKILNENFLKKCKGAIQSKDAIMGVTNNNSVPVSGEGLYVKFSDIEVNYDNYSLLCVIHFINLETQKEIAKTPLIKFGYKTYGFEKYLAGAMDFIASQLNQELN